jgi:hypothetical protein
MMMRGLPRSIKSTSLYRGALPEAFRRGIINFLPIAHSNAKRGFTSIAGRPNGGSSASLRPLQRCSWEDQADHAIKRRERPKAHRR